MVHEIGLKGRFIQIGLEIIDKGLKVRLVRIVTELIARWFPNVFLGIQRRASWREIQQFQARVLGQHLIWSMARITALG